MGIAAVIVAAGSSTRFGAPKQFSMLGPAPLLFHSLEAFDGMEEITERIVVLREEMLDAAAVKWMRRRLANPIRLVAGGADRSASVLAGLNAIESCELVAVHDGARPFVPVTAFRECIALMEQDRELAAAIVGTCVTDTLKLIDAESRILRTVDRSQTVRAETPQLCRVDLLQRALEAGGTPTDEAQALERAGHKTACVRHDGYNPKITRPFDLVLAEAWFRHVGIDKGSKTCYRGEIEDE